MRQKRVEAWAMVVQGFLLDLYDDKGDACAAAQDSGCDPPATVVHLTESDPLTAAEHRVATTLLRFLACTGSSRSVARAVAALRMAKGKKV